MGVEESWILFLERNPQFYELTKGDFFIRFLNLLSESAKSFSEIRASFPVIEEDDIGVILDALVKLNVVSRSKVGGNFFYALSNDGKKLLSTYERTHEFFKA